MFNYLSLSLSLSLSLQTYITKLMEEIQLNTLVFITLAALFLLWSVIKKLRGSKNSPPSPPKLPILGNLHQLGSLPHQSLQSMARKHGPIMLLHFGTVPVLIVSSADATREILKTHDTATADRPQYKAFKKLVYDGKNITFSPYGEYWKKLRTIFVVQLLSNKRVQSYRLIREEETALLAKKIGESSGPVNLSEMFAEFPNDLISRSALGIKCRESEKGRKMLLLLIELMELLGTINIGDFIPWLSWLDRINGVDERLERVAKEMDDFLENVIEERIKNRSQEENFVDIMLQIQNDKSNEVSIGREGIKSIVLDALAGGTDTISTAMEWTMAELLRHPAVMEKLRNEVRGIVKDKDEITDDDLDKMHYLKAVIKETLRCHPPVPILVPRVVREDVKIKGYGISRGTVVMINVWAIGRDPKSWDEPEEFWPERFLNTSVDFRGSNFELIPFGAGRRGCPGMTYGVAAIELVLANLVQKFYWELPNAAQGKDLDMRESPGLALHRAVPLLAVATKIT